MFIGVFDSSSLFAEKDFVQHGGRSDNHDADDDDLQVFFEIEIEFHQNELLQIMTGEQHGEYPGDTADEIIQPEFLFVHGHDTRNNGRKGPDDGQEAGKDDSFAAMFIVEFLGLVKVSFFEEPVVFPVKKKGAAFIAEPITNGISEDTTDGDQSPQEDEIQEIAARAMAKETGDEAFVVDAGNEEQTVSRKKEAEHKTGLGKYDEE